MTFATHTPVRRFPRFCRHALRRFATLCGRGAAAVLLVAGISARAVEAQDPAPLGDAYVFFVDGVNVTLPATEGVVVDDPKDATNKAIRFTNFNWGYQAFRFHNHAANPPTGAPRDMSANRAAENVIHFRILVDAANMASGGDTTNLAVMFEDYGDPMTEDLPFRLRWTIPASMRNGEWHEVALKLPPPTWKELEDGKTDGSISGNEANWVYGGAWTQETMGVALDLMGPNTMEQANLWKEFEWDNVRAVGLFWDWASAGSDGGVIHLDDVFIGPADFALSDAGGKPAAMSGVKVAADDDENVVSWTHNPDFGGYNVYASTALIKDVTDRDVVFLQKLSFEADKFEVRHKAELPYSSTGSTLYYAVTSLSQFGTENPDVTKSSVKIDNPKINVSPPVLSLTEEQSEALFDVINAGGVSKDDFPEGSMPFVVDDTHSQIADATVLPDDNDDLSASVWVAYYIGDPDKGLSPEIWVYAEVTDDMKSFAAAADEPNGAWAYDSIEFGWGNYDVRDAGGSVFGGSPHTDMERGKYPDYQLRISPHGTADEAIAKTFVFNGADKPNPGGGAQYASTANGYRVLAYFSTPDIKAMGDADADFPGPGETRLFPMTVTLNDRDGGEARAHQITWSLNPSVNNMWWNTPSQWQTVAMVGPAPPVSAEGDSELPEAYGLAQNYPNPFNPSTSIRFQLPQAEQVTLRVFDVLGREVAALLDHAAMAAGEHTIRFDASGLTSGVYLYRLEAGDSFAQTRRMMLMK